MTREHEAWENRIKHAKAARTWAAVAREHEGTDKKPTPAECRILAEWMGEYEAADAKAEAAFRALAADAKNARMQRAVREIVGRVVAHLDETSECLFCELGGVPSDEPQDHEEDCPLRGFELTKDCEALLAFVGAEP